MKSRKPISLQQCIQLYYQILRSGLLLIENASKADKNHDTFSSDKFNALWRCFGASCSEMDDTVFQCQIHTKGTLQINLTRAVIAAKNYITNTIWSEAVFSQWRQSLNFYLQTTFQKYAQLSTVLSVSKASTGLFAAWYLLVWWSVPLNNTVKSTE